MILLEEALKFISVVFLDICRICIRWMECAILEINTLNHWLYNKGAMFYELCIV
jgi:hypothetical protein